MEARGNVDYANSSGAQIGVKHISASLTFGPKWNLDEHQTVSFVKNNKNGFDRGFHSYEFMWNEKRIRFLVDGVEIGFVPATDGFWVRGDFHGQNIWASGTKMAPFDQEVCPFI